MLLSVHAICSSASAPVIGILYDAVGEEFGAAADLYPLALQRTDTRNTFIAATDTVAAIDVARAGAS